MIIETEEYRELIKVELEIFDIAETLAKTNKRYAVKCGVLVVKGQQIICGNLASFRATYYNDTWNFHPEATVLDMYSADEGEVAFYIAKTNISNEPVKSRPCVKCMKEIKANEEVVAIYYRDDYLRIVKEVLK